MKLNRANEIWYSESKSSQFSLPQILPMTISSSPYTSHAPTRKRNLHTTQDLRVYSLIRLSAFAQGK